MAETLVVEAEGSLHLLHNESYKTIKFVNEEGTPHTVMFLTIDGEPDRGDISRYGKAKITVVVEYEDEEYNIGVT